MASCEPSVYILVDRGSNGVFQGRAGCAGAVLGRGDLRRASHVGGEGVRKVCRWRDGAMVLRWAAVALLMTERNFRKITGYRGLWMLKAALETGLATHQQKVA